MKKPIARLHYITRDVVTALLLPEIESVCKGGVRWVQLRLKNKSGGEMLDIAKEVKAVCKKYDATFIINDHVNVANEVDADGVHLGKGDMSISEARKVLGNGKLIGGSTNTFEDILQVSKYNPDYMGLGPFRFSLTKEDLNPILGLDKIRTTIKKAGEANITTPVIAIGGIHLKDVEILRSVGVYGVAISSAINNSNNIEEEAIKFVNATSQVSADAEAG